MNQKKVISSELISIINKTNSMQNLLVENSAFYFNDVCKKDMKTMQDNCSSTSLKEDSSKNYDDYEKNSLIAHNFEFAGNASHFENLNEINLGLFSKSQNEDSDKKLFLGKKVKVLQVPLNAESLNNTENENLELTNFNNKNKNEEIKSNAQKKPDQQKGKKSSYSVFKINRKAGAEKQTKSWQLKQTPKKSFKEALCPSEAAGAASLIIPNLKLKEFQERQKNKKKEEQEEEEKKAQSSSSPLNSSFENQNENEINCESGASSEDSGSKLNLESSLDPDAELVSNAAAFPLGKRVSAVSKVNFTKLSQGEKDERLKNLAKMVKRLRRKVRNLENRFRSNASKILNKYLSSTLGIRKSSKINQAPLDLDIEKLSKALKMLRQYERFEYSDQKHAIENFVNLIAEEKIQLDSINFRKICTQIRIFLDKDSSVYIANKGQKITFSFPEKDVNITTKEYEMYSKYRDREDVIRTIIGVPEENAVNVYPERINFESKKLQEIQEFNANASKYALINSSINNANNYSNNAFKLQNYSNNNSNNNSNSPSTANSNSISFGQSNSNQNKLNSGFLSFSGNMPTGFQGNEYTGNASALQQLIKSQQQSQPNSFGFNKNLGLTGNNSNEEFPNQQKIFEQIKNIQINNCNFNELMNMGYYNNPAANAPSNNSNFHNLLINSMYSNILQNFSIPKSN